MAPTLLREKDILRNNQNPFSDTRIFCKQLLNGDIGPVSIEGNLCKGKFRTNYEFFFIFISFFGIHFHFVGLLLQRLKK